jgi:membrane protein
MATPTDWITLAEAAEILAAANIHFTAATIGGWARRGRLQSIKLGGRRFVRRAELRALVARHGVSARGTPARPVRRPGGLSPTHDAAPRSPGVDPGAAGVVLLRRVLDVYGRAAGGLLASGLAFSALFAAVPSTLLLLGLAGWVAAGDPALQGRIEDALIAAVPPLAELIHDSVNAVTDGAALVSILGVIGLVWTVSQLFGAADVAFARIFTDEPERTGVWRTVRGFVVVAILGVVAVAVIATLGLLAAIDELNHAQTSLARDVAGLLATPPALVTIACAAVIAGYRVLPPRPPRWGACCCRRSSSRSCWSSQPAFRFLVPPGRAAELAGSLASGFVALAWLSVSFQALLIGAAWVRVRDASTEPGSAALEGPASTAEPRGGGE